MVGIPGVCMHCGGHWLADESIALAWCGADHGYSTKPAEGTREAEQDRRARKALGFA